MPLKHGTSNKVRNENIKKEIHKGLPIAQAAAISYSVQRRARAKARANAGKKR